MKRPLRMTYKPSELQAALEALQNNSCHKFSAKDAGTIIASLYALGYRIVYIGEPKP